MKLTFKKKHVSIDRFNEIDLPDFVVLTGVNGSGKSHLLEAIENRSVLVDGKDNIKVVRFDYMNFYLEKEVAYNARQIVDERNSTWDFFQGNLKNQVESFRNNLAENYQRLADLSISKNKRFLSLTREDVADDTLFQQYDQYRQQVRNLVNQDGFKNNQQALSISAIINSISYSLDLISRDEFDDIFKPYQLKNDFLPHQLGRVIWNYYTKYRSNEVNEFQNERHGKSLPVLSEEDFVKTHGRKPWEIINDILDSFRTIEYRLPSPEGSDYFGDFNLKLEHPDKDLQIEFSALSSGEKVLMALIASIYKASSDNHFPDILLLDEIDASLHPSMIKNLLNAIHDVFLKSGTQVILVTHSPTTVALAPEESVHIMNKEGNDRIEKKSKSDALSILTEGFATLEEGLRIFDEISKQEISIISEGKNTELIRKALKLNNIEDVEVIMGVENISGKEQLKTIFDFISRIPHSKKVIVAWDPEVAFSLSEKDHTYPFIFPKNTNNNLTSKGIENLFDDSLFVDFTTTVRDSKGTERKTFDENRKKDFAAHVIARDKKDDFKNFEPLIAEIKRIRGL